MVAFEVWGKFAAFRDPFTISQNITLPIPPKTTVGGMMAAILGIDNYLKEEDFFNFDYSIVVENGISKQSFSQNYINDYTKFTSTHIDYIKKGEYDKLSLYGLRRKLTNKKWTPQSQVNRELLINPKYIIFVDQFKYAEALKKHLKERLSKYPFYLGNSEFAGNFNYLEVDEYGKKIISDSCIDSFLLEEDIESVSFENGIRYTNVTFATRLERDRAPIDFKSVIVANKPVKVKSLECVNIITSQKSYYCRFL